MSSLTEDLWILTTSYNLSQRLAEAGLGWTFTVDTGNNPKSGHGMQYYRIKEGREDYQIWLVYRKNSYLSKPMQYFMKLAESFENEDKSSLI